MKKSTGTAIITVMGLAFVGVAGFIFSRPAAAKNKAQKAFAVDPHCGSFLVVDEAKAKDALVAAAIAVAPSPDSSAIEALKQMLAFMFEQCDWTDPPDDRTFIRGTGQYLRWGDIESTIGQRTVGELQEFLEKFGVMQGASGKELPWLLPYVFGTGGCLECAMGTGGFGTGQHHQQKSSYQSGTKARGTGGVPLKKIPSSGWVWLPASDSPDRPRNKAPAWVQLIALSYGNIYEAILHVQQGKHIASTPVTVETRIIDADGTLEARVLP